MFKSFTLIALILEAIVLLYNRQVTAMLSMHPSCSGRSSTIENKLKMSGGGIGSKQSTKIIPTNVSFPIACLNHPKNLKAKNTINAYKITEATPLMTEQMKLVSHVDLKDLENNGINEEEMGNEGINKLNGKTLNENLKKINGEIKQKIIIGKETDPMWYNKASNLQKKIKQFYENAKLKNEFNDRSLIRRVIRREYTVDAPKDDQINLLYISELLMALNKQETTENLENAANLLIGLHECYQILTEIPIVFDVEMVLEKIKKEEGEERENKFKLVEYFRENEIKIPLWDLLNIKDSKDSVDDKINKLKNIIHKADSFLDKNMKVFIEQRNEKILNKIASRIEMADLVLDRVNYILNLFDNFKDDNLSKDFKILKRLSPIEKHDLFENSELLQKLFENILPGDEIMKF
ncbi:hypothetical protein Mgra_00003736 [Meloidogyne graminicola]|uniref:Uncharacterized protein n=1 Tax=Meloidogyne graminicola TaxID=189291 RepID=A0A8S9ZU60_9BILA|nr:hypothetical protein Mgra_00003736 [Meloidogyne graminicola]